MVAHLGPTNSGKTYAALRELVEKRAGVYAGPLRMLAQEAHRRLGDWIGAERVGLVTGEERVNERAPVICSTVEMAPQAGALLVLDEVQWADDAERGSAWTRLLLAGEYREILLLGALDALPLVDRAFPERELKVFERKLPLEFVGPRTLRSLTKGTVVVAFSRRAVLALAGEVNRLHPGRVAVLYGAMPLSSRREEIERFLSGAADVCVATDVLGHGVNLPCETLLFAETAKFDGEERRDLLPWELAQIAGRAGRFGLVERGHVGVLSGLGWGGDPELVESALEPHVRLPGGFLGYRAVDEARIRPQLADLGVEDPHQLGRRARRVVSRRAPRVGARELARGGVAPASPAPAEAIQRRLGERGRTLSLADTWKLVNAPVDEDGLELLGTLALAISGDQPARRLLAPLLDTAPATRRIARRRRAGRPRGEHPALVRAPVPGRRRRHDRAGDGARGDGCRPRRRAAALEIGRRRSDVAARAGVRARRGSRSATAARSCAHVIGTRREPRRAS